MQVTKVRDYSKRGDALPVPNLVEVQQAAYERLLQMDKSFDGRDLHMGLEALMREVFPIESYDGSMHLEYLYYKLDEPRYTPQECKDLRLTYGMPFRIAVRLVRQDVAEMPEEEIYLGEIPIMMGGGEFIVNGAERVIVNQLHRSPGVDFSVASLESDRPLHSARIIPERGSWIEIEVTKKDVLAMRIDQSTKIAATTFLRAIDEKLSTTDGLLGEFYDVSEITVGKLKPEHYAAAAIIDTESGEELVGAGHQIGEAIGKVQASSIGGSAASAVSEADAKKYIKDNIQHKVFPFDFADNALPEMRAALAEGLGDGLCHANTKDDLQAVLECIEDRLMIEYGPSENLKAGLEHLPLFNYEGPSTAEAQKILKKWEQFGQDLSWAKEFVSSFVAGVDDSAGWGNTSKKPGLYVFWDVSSGPDAIVYVGIAWKRGVSEEISTQRTSDAKGSSLVKQVLHWLRHHDRGKGGKAGTVAVITNAADPLILNTLAAENLEQFGELTEYEAALLKIYARLRPGNPPQVDKAKQLFDEKFFDENRYRLGKVGRFRINRKFGLNIAETEMRLRSEDFLHTIKYILDLRSSRNRAHTDDIDHLGNRRLRTLDELAVEEMRKGFLKLRRTVQERMSVKDPDELAKIADLINSKSISSSIDFFFGRGELSQVVDQTNPLSQLTHERRLSALGPGGLNRKRAGFEVRDVHISHYGRICPIETPEGTNIGLIASLGIYSKIDEYGFLLTPYCVLEKGQLTRKHKYLRADEEMKAVLAPSDAVDENGRIGKGHVLARVDGELTQSDGSEVEYIDISPKQIVGVSAALIPFLEHDDANRALMGSNMQRQAVPLIKTSPPVVATGMEKIVPGNSGMVVKARNGGTVTAVDAHHVVIDNAEEYPLRKFIGLNEKTCLNQKPSVRLGQKVKAGQIIADGAATDDGELALGKNVLVAFNTFDGYNFEDAIVMSEGMLKDDTFTSLHIEEFDVEIRETKLGREEFTRDIPNVSERQLANLDEYGVIRIGTHVKPGDILVGKVTPKSKSELTPEEKLLHAIFGRAGEDVKNDSLEVPAGTEGVVINTRRFSRRMHMTDEQKKQLRKDMKAYEQDMNRKAIALFRQMVDQINEVVGTPMVDPTTRQKVGASDIDEVVLEQIENFTLKWAKGSKTAQQQADQIHKQFWPRIEAVMKERDRRLAHMKRGDELPSGVLEMVKVWLCTKRQLSVGDKFAGRHGNKGVVARIVPEADMPFLEDGTPVDVLLNPLGVPSRMNVGQILETHLGWAANVLGFQAVTPVFDGATEDQVHEAIDEANQHLRERRQAFAESNTAPQPRELLVEMPPGGKVQLYDGRTGEPFDQKTTVGYMYLMKLHHLVDDKIHARATGPYSLITQQPLGGKARTGGQRFGEMEVWALEAYGAAYILQELLTVKSDDVEGRTKIYESMVKGTNSLEAGMPVAFDVLCNEIKGLGLNIALEKKPLEGGSLL